jgi:hypothetical protein
MSHASRRREACERRATALARTELDHVRARRCGSAAKPPIEWPAKTMRAGSICRSRWLAVILRKASAAPVSEIACWIEKVPSLPQAPR